MLKCSARPAGGADGAGDAAAGAAAWARTEALTEGLAGELAEQLRLILEPTVASRLAGDYRSGAGLLICCDLLKRDQVGRAALAGRAAFAAGQPCGSAATIAWLGCGRLPQGESRSNMNLGRLSRGSAG